MLQLLTALWLIPFLAGIISFLAKKNKKVIALTNLFFTLCLFLVFISLCFYAFNNTYNFWGFFMLDSLSLVFLTIVVLLGTVAILTSIPYINREFLAGRIEIEKIGQYFALLQFFIGTMLLLLIVENLGLMWVLVEATTLTSALLVAFYVDKKSVEAAWKYVMVCTVGICLALLGTILLYYAQVNVTDANPLGWNVLVSIKNELDVGLIKLAFVFIVIGYGTKVGLAPMHTWLPDAHSQAPSPVSALLSGALLSCTVYVLLRNLVILRAVLDADFISSVFLGLGFVSVLVAIPFVIKQADLKRLLAYSSVEHMGIVAVAIGVGSPLAIYALFLHLLNHAFLKTGLFCLAGEIIACYDTKNLKKIFGLCKFYPVLAIAFLSLILAITGVPPFGIFISKMFIIFSMVKDGNIWSPLFLLLLLGMIFLGMMKYTIRLSFTGSNNQLEKKKYSKINVLIVYVLLLFSLFLGLYIPISVHETLQNAAKIVLGG